jgi:hypothetical protein
MKGFGVAERFERIACFGRDSKRKIDMGQDVYGDLFSRDVGDVIANNLKIVGLFLGKNAET